MTILNEFVFTYHNSIYVYLKISNILAICARHCSVSIQNVYLLVYYVYSYNELSDEIFQVCNYGTGG